MISLQRVVACKGVTKPSKAAAKKKKACKGANEAFKGANEAFEGNSKEKKVLKVPVRDVKKKKNRQIVCLCYIAILCTFCG